MVKKCDQVWAFFLKVGMFEDLRWGWVGLRLSNRGFVFLKDRIQVLVGNCYIKNAIKMMVAYGHFQLRAKVIDPHDLHIFGDFFFNFLKEKYCQN